MQTSSFLYALPPFRSIAALLVMIFHADLFISPLPDTTLTGLLSHGWLWADGYFVLSGVVLMHVSKKYSNRD